MKNVDHRVLSLIFSIYTQSAEASLPKFNLVEDGATIEQVPVNGSVSARYTLTNNMKREVTLALQPMTGVTQDTSGNYCPNPIVLAAEASCTLAITISGSAFASEADGTVVINNAGPVVCNRISGGTTGAWCSQPLANERLNITKVGAEQPALAVEPSSITIIEGADDGRQTGSFTITNNSQTVTASEVKVTSVLPNGVTQDASDCLTILPQGSCSLPLTAAPGATVGTHTITIAGRNTDSLQAQGVIKTLTCGGDACGVFVSSEIVTIPIRETVGDVLFEGRVAADKICQRLAAVAKLPRAANYRAWLSTSTSDAIDHVGYAQGVSYVRAAHRAIVVLESNADLASGNLNKAIVLTELAQHPTHGTNSWTGTLATGLKSEHTCENWVEKGKNGQFGFHLSANNSWTNTGWQSCSDDNDGIYCFEKPSSN